MDGVDYQLLEDDHPPAPAAGSFCAADVKAADDGGSYARARGPHPHPPLSSSRSGWRPPLAVAVGLLAYTTVVALVLTATQGGLGRLLADQTPANFVYVMLMQLTLLVWLLAGVARVWATSGIPASAVLEPNQHCPPAIAGLPHEEDLDLEEHDRDREGEPPDHQNQGADEIAVIAAAFSGLLGCSLAIYLGLCWDEANDAQNDCVSGSPIVVEFVGVCLVLGIFCLPRPLPLWPARRRLLWRIVQSLGCVLGRPLCGEVGFVHVVVADTLTSCCLMLWQLEYTIASTSFWVHLMRVCQPSATHSCRVLCSTPCPC